MMDNESRYEVFQELKSGELFELVAFFDNSACFKRLRDNTYLAASMPYFSDENTVSFRTSFVCKSKSQAIDTARAINRIYTDYLSSFPTWDEVEKRLFTPEKIAESKLRVAKIGEQIAARQEKEKKPDRNAPKKLPAGKKRGR